MSKNFHSRGWSLSVPAPSGGVVSGAGVLIGALFGVAGASAAAGNPVVLDTVGCFTLPKVTGTAFAVGDALWWDADPGRLTKTPADGVLVGVAIEVAGSDATSAVVRLNGVFGAASAAELDALEVVVSGLE